MNELATSVQWRDLDQYKIYKKALLLESTPVADSLGCIHNDCISSYCVITQCNSTLDTSLEHDIIDICAESIKLVKEGNTNRVRLKADTLVVRTIACLDGMFWNWKINKKLVIMVKKLTIVQPFDTLSMFENILNYIVGFYNVNSNNNSGSFDISPLHIDRLDIHFADTFSEEEIAECIEHVMLERVHAWCDNILNVATVDLETKRDISNKYMERERALDKLLDIFVKSNIISRAESDAIMIEITNEFHLAFEKQKQYLEA